MNRDEILKMDNRELKLAVAKHVMGIAVNDGIPCKHPGCTQHVSRPCEGCGRYHPILIPDYPSDIAAAWMVVDALSKRNIHFVIFSQNNVVMTFKNRFGGDYISEAGGADDSITSAIYRAALLAVMEFD